MQSMNLDDRIISKEDKIRKMELELDLKDYYDIKRPAPIYNSPKIRKYVPYLGENLYSFTFFNLTLLESAASL